MIRVVLALVIWAGGPGIMAQAAPVMPSAPPGAPVAAPPDAWADAAIRARWARNDGPVADGTVRRPWLWGPGPFYSTYEPFNGTPTGARLVQYFDKGRLEVNDPGADRSSPWFVSSGLLVKELVLGRLETGVEAGDYEARPAATIPISGEDVGSGSAPAYRVFADYMGRASNATGQPVARLLDDEGRLTTLPDVPAPVRNAYYEAGVAHNIADVFWTYMNSTGPVVEDGRQHDGQLFDWVYTMGLPITEPLWVRASVGGQQRPVLVQLFERRVLTYTPGNPPGQQVEMGNVGRHYHSWRYGEPWSDDKEAATRTRYTVQAQVNARRVVTVQETVRYTNTTAARHPLKELVLRAIYHHWEGVLTLTGVSVAGQRIEARWRDDVNLNLPLPNLLAPGATVEFTLEFTIRPRSFGGRHGYDASADLLSLGDWLPTVVPYENGGWLQFPYAEIGDQGINATADYRVEFTGDSKMIVAGSGEATTHTGGHWVYEAPGVRDVAYAVSGRLLNPYADSSLTRRVGDTVVRGFFLPGHRANAAGLLDQAASALRWYGGRISPYPYRSFVISEMGYPTEPQWDFAQEYPQVYFIPTQRVPAPLTPGSWAWLTPVHEVAHQWYYSTVGNSQLQDPWLDEALASFLNAEYVRAQRPDLYPSVWALITGPGVGRPVSGGLFAGYGKDEASYFRTTYDLGSVFVGEVYRAMGADRFWAALRDYTGRLAGGRAHPSDLLRTWQSYSPTPLESIFDRYLAYR